MADDDRTDAARLYAKDVALDPAVGGATNVQDALTGASAGVFVNAGNGNVQADTATHLTGDGGSHDVACLIASPPAWMDNAGNITEAGLYAVSVRVTATAGPTTPGLYVGVVNLSLVTDYVPCDALGSNGSKTSSVTVALDSTDVPSNIDCLIGMPTDATEAVDILMSVSRYASG